MGDRKRRETLGEMEGRRRGEGGGGEAETEGRERGERHTQGEAEIGEVRGEGKGTHRRLVDSRSTRRG